MNFNFCFLKFNFCVFEFQLDIYLNRRTCIQVHWGFLAYGEWGEQWQMNSGTNCYWYRCFDQWNCSDRREYKSKESRSTGRQQKPRARVDERIGCRKNFILRWSKISRDHKNKCLVSQRNNMRGVGGRRTKRIIMCGTTKRCCTVSLEQWNLARLFSFRKFGRTKLTS